LVQDKIYGLDLRSLTRFRQIAALFYIFFFFVLRLLYFEYYSVETGPFSNTALEVLQNPPLLMEMISGDKGLVTFLTLGLIPALLLFFGIFPSLSAISCCVLYIISARRFVPYYYGTDEIMIVMLLILGIVYILDPVEQAEDNYISIRKHPLILLLLVQVAIIYWFNGLNKTHMYWWSGEAVRMTVFNVLFNKPLGIEVFKFKYLNIFLTYFTLVFELLFPLLIFFPFKRPQSRLALGILIVVFHWGIDLVADVSMYKYMALGFLVLLTPGYIWDKHPFLSKLWLSRNYRLSKRGVDVRILKVLAYSLCTLFFFKAVIASVDRQNERYRFIENENIRTTVEALTSRTYSPFRQYWFMFAPSPPVNTGYIAFEYVDPEGWKENINIYGDNMPDKEFRYFHPFHLCGIMQFGRVSKGAFPEESQFILSWLFEHEVKKNIAHKLERRWGNYYLVLYSQDYLDYLDKRYYDFNRMVLGSYE